MVDSPVPANSVDNATKRFSSRVERYAKYRPGYPQILIDFLKDACDLKPDHVVADVGSGTGLLAELFLKNGNAVYAIEPNPDMRAVAEQSLAGYRGFRSIAATAEHTTLPSRSVDLVAVGRTFHWLQADQALSEFERILKPEGWAVIVWFKRRSSSPFLAKYEELLLSYGIDRREMRQRRLVLENFLAASGFKTTRLEEKRLLSLDALQGLTLSYSTAPEPDDPNVVAMMHAIEALFQQYQHSDAVPLGHDIIIYYKQLCGHSK
jgi:ubiquinone/menaquinone biosynthesis C-methylase UbiE